MLWSNSWIKGKILMLEQGISGFRDFFHFSLLFRFAFFLFVPRFFCVTRVYLNLSLVSICLVTCACLYKSFLVTLLHLSSELKGSLSLLNRKEVKWKRYCFAI